MFFKKIKLSRSVDRVIEDSFYEQVAIEIANKDINLGTWTRAKANAAGDKDKTEALYIKYRVQTLHDTVNAVEVLAGANTMAVNKTSNTEHDNSPIEKEHKAKVLARKRVERLEKERKDGDEKKKGFFGKLSNGEFGLAKTYWLYGVLVGFIVNICLKLINSEDWLIVCIFVYIIYQMHVIKGTWRAANKYEGSKVWPVLAKITVVFGGVALLVSVLGITNNIVSEESVNNQKTASPVIDVQKASQYKSEQKQSEKSDNNSSSQNSTVYKDPHKTEDIKSLTTIRFEFSGDTWIDVSDQSGERIAYGDKNAGYFLVLLGLAPFKISLVKPEAIKITYLNEDVVLPKSKNGAVVTFIVPESSD